MFISREKSSNAQINHVIMRQRHKMQLKDIRRIVSLNKSEYICYGLKRSTLCTIIILN